MGKASKAEGDLFDFARDRGVTLTHLPGLGREIRILADFASVFALYRMIKTFKPEIVHTHTAKAGLVGRLAARLAGVPVIVHTFHGHVLRGYFGPAKTALFRGLERAASRVTDALVAVSETVRGELVEMGVASPERIRVIPLGLDLGRLQGSIRAMVLRRELRVPEQAPLIGMVGRLVEIKDVPTFLQSAALVARDQPHARFVVVGDGDERHALEGLTARIGLTDRVSFVGWRRDLHDVYPDLDVVVNSSLNEGTPVALIEALAAGRPVVATQVGGTPDLLNGGRFGTLVPPRDPAALAQAILDVLRNPRDASERAEAGRAHVLAHHSVDRLLSDVDALYRELLQTRRRAA